MSCSSNGPRPLNRNIAFTLVELLVVLAIVSLLAALLLPSLRRSRQIARQVVCINNVRQLTTGLQLYINDWNGFLPVCNPHNLAGPTYDYGGWIPQLAPYTLGRTNSNASSFNVPTTSVFYCPIKTTGTWASGQDYRWAYAINHDLRQRYGVNTDGTNPMNISEFKNHGRTMAFTENGPYADVLQYQFLDYGLWGYPSMPVPSASAPAHGGKGIPFAYLDGHAEFWSRMPNYDTYHADIWNPGQEWPWAYKAFWGYAPGTLGGTTYAVTIAPYE